VCPLNRGNSNLYILLGHTNAILKAYFSFLTPLKCSLSAFWSMNSFPYLQQHLLDSRLRTAGMTEKRNYIPRSSRILDSQPSRRMTTLINLQLIQLNHKIRVSVKGKMKERLPRSKRPRNDKNLNFRQEDIYLAAGEGCKIYFFLFSPRPSRDDRKPGCS